jgi:hypothetical protein
MTAMFVAMVLAVFAGGVCLWLSGLLLGRRPRRDAISAAETVSELRADHARLEAALATANSLVEEAESRAKRAEDIKGKAEEEVGRAATELGSAAGEMARAEAEIARLKKENDELQEQIGELQQAAKPRLRPPPLPPVKSDAGEKHAEVEESADLDFALAQLDIERVAHKKTRDELDQLKKSGGVQISDGRPSVPPAVPGFGVPGRRGAGYQTVSIAARGQPVAAPEHDRLRQSHDQLQREKERIEAELTRAQQELQLLKMRQP